MRVRLTELGVKGLLLLAALELAFLATSYSNLFFLLIVFCAVLGVIGIVTGIRNLRAVRLLAIDVPAGPAGEERPVRVSIDARRRVFDLVLTIDDGQRGLPLTPVASVHGRQTLSCTLPPQTRGVRHGRHLRIASRFPFGLFELRLRRLLSIEVVTYPRPTPAAVGSTPRHHAGQHAGDAAQPATVAGLRPFRSGDQVRDVHWKATARRGVPIVKEREGEAGDERTLRIDRRCPPDELERQLADAAAAVLGAVSAVRGVQLVSQGCSLRVAAGKAAPADALRWLALADVLPADAPAPELPPRRGLESAHA